MYIPVKKASTITRILGMAVVYLLFASSAKAQSESNPYFAPHAIPQAPNAAGISRYGEYQVNEFSGVPDISIPLYEITSGDLKVPITLSYHASGIKVTDVASWAGLGWTLNTGGQITRNVMGYADEDINGYLFGGLRHRENIDNTITADLQYLSNVKNQAIDVKPDIFSYNIGAKSGKFFFNGNDSNRIVYIPNSAVKIKSNLTGHTLDFDVKDEDGNQYSFGKNVADYVSTTRGSSVVTSVTTAWWTNYMISQNRRDTILYGYNPSQQVTLYDHTDMITVDDQIGAGTDGTNGYSNDPGTGATIDNSTVAFERLVSEIDYKNGKVVFDLSPTNRQERGMTNGKSLQDIKVYNQDPMSGQYLLIKTINFYQSYFGTDANTKRLRLDSIGICDNLGNTIQRYKFVYNNSITVPNTNTSDRDYWGYYNAAGNSTMVPRMNIDYVVNLVTSTITIGGNVGGRDVNPSWTQAYMLQSIYYPTGGHTDFAFENNSYLDTDGQTVKLAGGLRVKSIKSYDTISPLPMVKTYEYAAARPNFILNNYYFSTSQAYKKFTTPTGSPSCEAVASTKRVRTFTSTPSINLEPYDAVPVAYTHVIEYNGDGTRNNGKTDYFFNDQADGLNTTGTWTGEPIVYSNFYARGQLINKTIYRVDGGGAYHKVAVKAYGYSATNAMNYLRVGLAVGKHAINDDYGGGAHTFDASLGAFRDNPSCSQYNDDNSYTYADYDISTADNYMSQELDTTFDQSDDTKYLSTNTYYGRSPVHQQISSIISTDSKGTQHTVKFSHPEDYLLTGSTTSTGMVGLDTMILQGMRSAVVEKVETISGTEGVTGTPVINAQFSSYKRGGNGASILNTQSTLQISQPISDFVPATISGGQFQKDARYSQLVSMDAYDPINNIAQYTTRNALPVSLLWDYHQSLPIAQVKGAVITDIAYTSFEAEGKGGWVFSGNPAFSATAPTGGRVYALSSGNISRSVLDNSKQYIVSYWSNGAAATVNSSTAVAGFTKNGWTYYQHTLSPSSGVITISGTATIDELRLFPVSAEMTTYTYTPGVGTTTTTTPDNMTTYYEYDIFGRLMLVRDNDRNVIKTYDYRFKK